MDKGLGENRAQRIRDIFEKQPEADWRTLDSFAGVRFRIPWLIGGSVSTLSAGSYCVVADTGIASFLQPNAGLHLRTSRCCRGRSSVSSSLSASLRRCGATR